MYTCNVHVHVILMCGWGWREGGREGGREGWREGGRAGVGQKVFPCITA